MKTALDAEEVQTTPEATHYGHHDARRYCGKFADALKQFEPIDGQPSETDLTRIWEVVALLHLQILYDETGSTHNLIGLIRPVAAYITRYGVEFAEPTSVGTYNATIDDDSMAIVRARTESAHRAKRVNRGTLEMAQQETVQFILDVLDDTWLQELRDTEMFYTDVSPKALLAHLHAVCTGRHSLELLALHIEMQQCQLEVKGIPKYINMLKDAQKQVGRSGRTISNITLLLFASTEMLTTEKYPRTNNIWEDRDKDQKT